MCLDLVFLAGKGLKGEPGKESERGKKEFLYKHHLGRTHISLPHHIHHWVVGQWEAPGFPPPSPGPLSVGFPCVQGCGGGSHNQYHTLDFPLLPSQSLVSVIPAQEGSKQWGHMILQWGHMILQWGHIILQWVT